MCEFIQHIIQCDNTIFIINYAVYLIISFLVNHENNLYITAQTLRRMLKQSYPIAITERFYNH